MVQVSGGPAGGEKAAGVKVWIERASIFQSSGKVHGVGERECGNSHSVRGIGVVLLGQVKYILAKVVKHSMIQCLE